MRLSLVRHGQTAWNVEMRAQGHTDVPLDEVGIAQAKQLAKSLKGQRILKIVSSDLQRAADTAREIAETIGAPLILDARLRERSLGDFEGIPFSEFQKELEAIGSKDGLDPWLVRAPNGESLQDVYLRIEPVAEWLFAEEEETLIVGHGAVCAVLTARLVRGSVATSRSFRFSNAGLTEFVRHAEGTFRMVRYDDTSHLTGEKPLTGSVDGASR